MADRSNLWKVARARGDFIKLTLRDSAGTALVLEGTETLAGTVWGGDDLAPLSGVLTLTHETPASGIIRATVVPAQTAAVTPGYYRVALDITLGGTVYRFWAGWMEIQDTAGTATEPPTYCSLQDMLDLGGSWLPSLMMESGRSNFVAVRARARDWFDSAFLARCRNDVGYVDLLGPFYPWMTPEQDNPTIRDYLADDLLIVTGDVKEACACKAIGFACETAITGEPGDPWPARAARFHARARSLLLTLRPGIDTNADGEPDITVNMSYVSRR